MAKYGIKVNGNKLIEGMDKQEAKEMFENLKKANEPLGLEIKMFIQMNQHEKEIDRLIQNAVSEWIGGFENTMADYPTDSEEYRNAQDQLNHDTLFELIYDNIMTESRKNKSSHIRFAGKEFITDRIEKRLKQSGYGKA